MWRYEGKGEHEWAQTAPLISLLYNANRPKDAASVDPDDINPFVKTKRKRRRSRSDVSVKVDSMAEAFGVKISRGTSE